MSAEPKIPPPSLQDLANAVVEAKKTLDVVREKRKVLEGDTRTAQHNERTAADYLDRAKAALIKATESEQ